MKVRKIKLENPTEDFASLWHQLDLSFGATGQDQLRQQLKALRLVTQGRLTESEWTRYYGRVVEYASYLPDMGSAEVARILTEAIPVEPLRRRLAEEALRKVSTTGLTVDGLPDAATVGDVVDLVVEETQRNPLKVEKKGRVFRIQAQDEQHCRDIKKALDRQGLQGTGMLIVGADEVALTPADINRTVEAWIRVGQKAAVTPNQQANLRPRFTRELKVEDEDDEEEDRIRQVSKDGGAKKKEKAASKTKVERKVEEQVREKEVSPSPPPASQPPGPAPGKGSGGGPSPNPWWTANPWPQQQRWGYGDWGGRGGYGGPWQWQGKGKGDGMGKGEGQGKGMGKGKGKAEGKGAGKGDGKGAQGKGWQE